ncbi:hypothetical protein KSP40_PGU008473 [Platanthera guangdongensis]|uniref:Uncharacterized protein n=1 Tax=Platanthera guangdongensis TaxID=2320717 RepID=A0ABR2MZJ1_9ASPA
MKNIAHRSMALYARLDFLLPCSSEKQLLFRPLSSSSFSGLARIQNGRRIPKATTSNPTRRSGNFQPTIWHDSYIQTLPGGFEEEECLNRRNELKEDVRHLIGKEKCLVEQLELLDNLRQLGLSYHFELEIKDAVQSISSMESTNSELENSLHGTALLFRLLREYELDASQLSVSLINMFKMLKDGSSKLNVVHDIKGMLSLYEASYLAVKGEEDLDEASDFSAKYLGKVRGSALNPQIIKQIDHALELPLHWRMPRLHTRWFIDAYETQENMYPMLLEFAKLDFNMVQGVHRKEIKEMSRWWENLGIVCDELSFARDRLVEHYLWAMGFCFDLKFWTCRKGLAKMCCFITTIDDVYDVYGTLDELELFTEMVEKWEFSALELLPDYMKTCLTLLFNTMNEIACTNSTAQGSYVLSYLKRSWADLCKAYLTEARWYHTGYTPTLNEYLENAWASISSNLLLVFAHCVSGDVTVDSLNKFEFYPDIVRYSSILFRLYDDMGTSTDEMQRGDVPKSIQCYMKEKNVSESIARDYIKCLIKKYWTLLNHELAINSMNLDPFKRVAINIPRMAQCMYQHGDGHGVSNLRTRDIVISLLIDPINV